MSGGDGNRAERRPHRVADRSSPADGVGPLARAMRAAAGREHVASAPSSPLAAAPAPAAGVRHRNVAAAGASPAEPIHRRASEGALRRSNQVIAVVMTLVVVLSPLPVGSNRGAAWMGWAAVIFVAAGLYFLRVAAGDLAGRLRSRALVVPLGLAAAALLWGVVQILPLARLLPLSLVRLPETAGALPATISLTPAASATALLRMGSTLLFFVLMVEAAARPQRARLVATVLFAASVAYAAWGIVALKLLGDIHFWGEKTAYPGSATGPFINRNAFASYLGMGAVLGLSLLPGAARAPGVRWPRTLLLLLTPEGAVLALMTMGILLDMICLLLTQSRLGLLATLCGLVTVAMLSPRAAAGHARRRRLLTWGILGLIALVALSLSSGVVGRSILLARAGAARLDLYREELGMILHRAFTGYGLDSFPRAFELVHRPPVELDAGLGHGAFQLPDAVERPRNPLRLAAAAGGAGLRPAPAARGPRRRRRPGAAGRGAWRDGAGRPALDRRFQPRDAGQPVHLPGDRRAWHGPAPPAGRAARSPWPVPDRRSESGPGGRMKLLRRLLDRRDTRRDGTRPRDGAATLRHLSLDRPNMAIHAIGDLHGAYDLYRKTEDRIADEVRAAGEGPALLILLGDIIDRGPHSARLVEHLCQPAPDGIERFCLAGNHEDMALRFLAVPSGGAAWLGFGGAETLASYGMTPDAGRGWNLPPQRLADMVAAHVPDRHLAFLRRLPHSLSAGGMHFSHAGPDSALPMLEQSPERLMWATDFKAAPGPPPEWLGSGCAIQGHIVVPEPQRNGWRIDIDTGAWATGMLGSARIGIGADIPVELRVYEWST